MPRPSLISTPPNALGVRSSAVAAATWEELGAAAPGLVRAVRAGPEFFLPFAGRTDVAMPAILIEVRNNSHL